MISGTHSVLSGTRVPRCSQRAGVRLGGDPLGRAPTGGGRRVASQRVVRPVATLAHSRCSGLAGRKAREGRECACTRERVRRARRDASSASRSRLPPTSAPGPGSPWLPHLRPDWAHPCERQPCAPGQGSPRPHLPHPTLGWSPPALLSAARASQALAHFAAGTCGPRECCTRTPTRTSRPSRRSALARQR